MPSTTIITSPQGAAVDELCAELAIRSDALDLSGQWPAEQLRLCSRYGVLQWFVPREWGGQGWSSVDVVRGYLRLSEACLSTTFILTQRTGACRRIATSGNERLKGELLPKLASGEIFASVGISHLTTSRRHLSGSVLRAREVSDGFVLDGYSPWVTGGIHCEVIVLGATFDDGRQILAAVPTHLPGLRCAEPEKLIGVAASHTGRVLLDTVHVEHRWLLDGPTENVMSKGTGANTGGLETSALAIGLASAAIRFLEDQSKTRPELSAAADSLRAEQLELKEDLLKTAAGQPVCPPEKLRSRANSIALRSTQASLAAAKGTGYVAGHPAGRWCREGLFFLVWSCPQPVVNAALCELAALD